MSSVRRRQGFSLVEVLIAAAIAAVVLGATFMVVFAVTRQDQALRLRSDMHTEATRALKHITELLRRSGPIDANGDWILTGNGAVADNEFPVILDDTVMDSSALLPSPYDFAVNDKMVRATDKAAMPTGVGPDLKRLQADTYAAGKGPSYEMIFRVATDGSLDADDLPIEGATGAIEWGSQYHAFVVVPTYPGGAANPTLAVNELQHWIYDQTSGQTTKRTLASGVERLLFETVNRKEADPPCYPLDKPLPPSKWAPGDSSAEDAQTRDDNWPAAPTGVNPFMVRITLCLTRLGPDMNLIKVWQQANITMRCVNRGG